MAKKVPQWGTMLEAVSWKMLGLGTPVKWPERVSRRSFTGWSFKRKSLIGSIPLKLPEKVPREAAVPLNLESLGSWTPLESGRGTVQPSGALYWQDLTSSQLAKEKYLQSSSLLSQSRQGRVDLDLRGHKLITGTEDNIQVFKGPWDLCFLFAYLPPIN